MEIFAIIIIIFYLLSLVDSGFALQHQSGNFTCFLCVSTPMTSLRIAVSNQFIAVSRCHSLSYPRLKASRRSPAFKPDCNPLSKTISGSKRMSRMRLISLNQARSLRGMTPMTTDEWGRARLSIVK